MPLYRSYNALAVQEIKETLTSLGIKNILANHKICDNVIVDVFFPDFNIAIDFVDNFLDSEFIIKSLDCQHIHANKFKECNKLNIKLLTIFEHIWKEKKNQFLNMLKSKLNIINEKVMARKCSTNNIACKKFFNDNHIQGYGAGTLFFSNLAYKGEIIGSMTFSRHHRGIGDNLCVLNRMCFTDGFLIIGGASKMLNHAKQWAKLNNFNQIISWSDNAWTNGDVYSKLGFTLKSESRPDYFYWNIISKEYSSKQSQKKAASGCPPEIKEKDFSIQKNLYRVWNCGMKAWIMDI